MFKTSQNKGFSMTFENGNTVSVQWGPGNYCEPTHPHGRNARHDEPMKSEFWGAETAEVAAWDSNGAWHKFEHDTVDGWLTADEVIVFLHFVATSKLNISGSSE